MTLHSEQQQVINSVAEAIFEVTKISLDKIKSKDRKEAEVFARHYFFYYLSNYHSNIFNLSVIGKICNRDHSTVIHGRQQILNYLSYSSDKGILVKQMNELLNGKDYFRNKVVASIKRNPVNIYSAVGAMAGI